MRDHWEGVYRTRAVDALSWYRARLELSLRMIEHSGATSATRIIDVGGGASTLVDDLLVRGHRGVTVLDVSAAALAAAQARLGTRAAQAEWLQADVTATQLPVHRYDVWHDRAVFHFLTSAADRASYLGLLTTAVRPGGCAIIATFAEDGPSRCSGLPVVRYSAEGLSRELGAGVELVEQATDDHRTPAGAVQRFLYCRFRRR